MAEDTDLLPWVLGGMLALGAVAAIAVGVPDSTPGNAPTAPIATSAHIEPTGPSTVSAAHSAAAANLSPVVVAPNARPQLPTGQVWECNLNGQRVFSYTQVIAVRDRPRRDRLAHHGNHPHPRAARP